MNVSVSSQLSNEGSVTDSGVLLTDTLLMVVLTLHGDGGMWEGSIIHVTVVCAHVYKRKCRDRVPTWHSTVGNGRQTEMLRSRL